MVYGLISEKDDSKTKVWFQGKQIKDQNVVGTYQVGHLISMLQKGDEVYVVNVNRFPTVRCLELLGKACIQKGVSLHIREQPHLDITKGKTWKSATIWQMDRMHEIEGYAKACLQRNMKMSNDEWELVYRCFEIMNLEILGQTFYGDGILKK